MRRGQSRSRNKALYRVIWISNIEVVARVLVCNANRAYVLFPLPQIKVEPFLHMYENFLYYSRINDRAEAALN